MRLSISTASVPASSSSTGIFLPHRPMSEFGARRVGGRRVDDRDALRAAGLVELLHGRDDRLHAAAREGVARPRPGVRKVDVHERRPRRRSPRGAGTRAVRRCPCPRRRSSPALPVPRRPRSWGLPLVASGRLSQMTARTWRSKIWDDHAIGDDLLFIDLHLVHEVSSPQAFEGLRAAGRTVRRVDRTLATADHNVPTTDLSRPIADPVSRAQLDALSANVEGVRHPVLRARPCPSGHRPRDRARARADAAGHDDRVRRLAHLDARRVRRARVRDRHERGRARARDADAAAEARRDDARDVHGMPGRAWARRT